MTSTTVILSLKACILLIYQRPLMTQIFRSCCDGKHMASAEDPSRDIPEMIKPTFRAMTHNEMKYPNPEEFKPERFLRQDGSLTSDTMSLAFGWGRRVW